MTFSNTKIQHNQKRYNIKTKIITQELYKTKTIDFGCIYKK